MWAEARSLVAIGLLAAVMLRVCLLAGAGSGESGWVVVTGRAAAGTVAAAAGCAAAAAAAGCVAAAAAAGCAVTAAAAGCAVASAAAGCAAAAAAGCAVVSPPELGAGYVGMGFDRHLHHHLMTGWELAR